MYTQPLLLLSDFFIKVKVHIKYAHSYSTVVMMCVPPGTVVSLFDDLCPL